MNKLTKEHYLWQVANEHFHLTQLIEFVKDVGLEET